MQLLGELLLDRANVKVMMRYVSSCNNLQLMMVLLKDPSNAIQYEAFHVFKVLHLNSYLLLCDDTNLTHMPNPLCRV